MIIINKDHVCKYTEIPNKIKHIDIKKFELIYKRHQEYFSIKYKDINEKIGYTEPIINVPYQPVYSA